MSKKKIGVVLDTNIFHDRSGRRSIMEQIGLFLSYSRDLDLANSGVLKIILPDISIEEFLQQKKDRLENDYNSLIDRYDSLSKYVLEQNQSQRSTKSLAWKGMLLLKKVMVLSIEPSEDLFKKMIDDAIQKNPPFDKNSDGQKTDAGSKDALIWNTILESKEIDGFDSLYFVS